LLKGAERSDIHNSFRRGSIFIRHAIRLRPSLVAESILPSTVRALPGDGIAGHAPYIFFHTVLADTESTPALPAEGQFPAAAMANMMALTVFPPIGRSYFRVFHGCCFIALLIYTLKILMQAANHVKPSRLVYGVFTLSRINRKNKLQINSKLQYPNLK